MGSTDYAGKSAYRGEVAAHYDRDRATEPLWAIEQVFVERWAATLRPGAIVMDLPAGTGRFVEVLLARGLCVQALDVSEDMLAEIRKRPGADNPRLTIAQADAERLAAGEGTIDHVLCWRLFHLLPLDAIERVLGEFRRVCRGQIVVQVLPVRTGGWAAHVPTVMKRWLRPVRRWWRSTGPAKPWSHIPSRVHAERDLLVVFRRAGLGVVAAETIATYDGLPVRVYTLTAET